MNDKEFRVRLQDEAVDLMSRMDRGTLPVCGESMRPTLRPGHVLAVEFSPSSLQRGDLLLFRQADYLVVHRLLGNARAGGSRPSLRTRGDGVTNLDPPLERSRVVGRAIAVQVEDGWRGLRGRRARVYAWALALHDLAWAALGVLAARFDRLARGAGGSLSLSSLVRASDRQLLHLVHWLLFSLVHPRIESPKGARDTGLKVEGAGARRQAAEGR